MTKPTKQIIHVNKQENQRIEFKKQWHDDILKTVCAFANTAGGGDHSESAQSQRGGENTQTPELFMKSAASYRNQDIFFWLKRPTIVEMRAVLEWANKHALRTNISSRDVHQFGRREIADKKFEEIIPHINRSAKPYFRIILRKNQNWYLLLTDKKHIEDLLEVGIRGIDAHSKEYFIQCFLKKELLDKMRDKFHLVEAVCQPSNLRSAKTISNKEQL